MSQLDFIKFGPPMTQLQETVVDLGVCFKCHTKTLVLRHGCKHLIAWQCSKCLTVVILPPASTNEAGDKAP